MAVVVFVLIAIVLAADARGPAGAISSKKWVTGQHHLVVDGLERSYILRRPADEGTGVLPVVIVLHGRDMTPAEMEAHEPVPPAARAIVVYPEGYGRSWNAGACCGPAHADRVDDVTFLTAVVRDVLGGERGASADGVFLVGYSNGGRMALRMACIDPALFAGIAAIEAVSVFPCTHLTAPVSLLSVASRGDPLLVIPHGEPPKAIEGYTEPTVEDQVAEWRTLDGCAPAASKHAVGTLTSTSWDGCAHQARVAFDLYDGGSHAIPAGDDRTPSASLETWAFFHAVRPSVVSAA
jgi:polyhydroxybutyrate depolymerase